MQICIEVKLNQSKITLCMICGRLLCQKMSHKSLSLLSSVLEDKTKLTGPSCTPSPERGKSV